MLEAPFLQSVICPIFRYVDSDAGAHVEKLHGTGFFVGNEGVFLTAKHVLEEAFEDARGEGGKVGVFPIQSVNDANVSLSIEIEAHEFAPHPFDVAVAKTKYPVASFLKLSTRVIDVWLDVATTGYAADLAVKDEHRYEAQQRALKGYIQRLIPRGRIKISSYPDCFETSFPITQGLSGAPLFVNTRECGEVIGICVGSLRSSIVDFSYNEIVDGARTLSEKTSRIHEVGIANDIRSLVNWTPKIIGRPLGSI